MHNDMLASYDLMMRGKGGGDEVQFIERKRKTLKSFINKLVEILIVTVCPIPWYDRYIVL